MDPNNKVDGVDTKTADAAHGDDNQAPAAPRPDEIRDPLAWGQAQYEINQRLAKERGELQGRLAEMQGQLDKLLQRDRERETARLMAEAKSSLQAAGMPAEFIGSYAKILINETTHQEGESTEQAFARAAEQHAALFRGVLEKNKTVEVQHQIHTYVPDAKTGQPIKSQPVRAPKSEEEMLLGIASDVKRKK